MNNIIEAFESSVKKVELWHVIEASTWKNRLKKFFRHPLRYILYQISKKYPVFIVAKTFLGTKFTCYLPDYFLMWCYGIVGDPSEIKLTRFFLKNLHEGDVVLDVGSNCGFYAVLSSRLVGEEGNVHAFEPTPDIYKMLTENTKELSNVYPTKMAVSDKNGYANFSVNSIYTVANSLVITSPDPSSKTISVSTITLDEYCSSKNIQPTLIKLDVEGAEKAVVRGAKRLLSETTPSISLEILEQGTGADYSATEELIGLGYTPHRILEHGELEEISLSDIMSLFGDQKNAFENFIFKKL